MRIFNYQLGSGLDMSTSFTSGIVILSHISIVSAQCSWSGSPVGKISIQASNDSEVWSDVSPSQVTINGSGNILYNLPEIGYLYFRVKYSAVSGSGNMDIIVNAKGE